MGVNLLVNLSPAIGTTHILIESNDRVHIQCEPAAAATKGASHFDFDTHTKQILANHPQRTNRMGYHVLSEQVRGYYHEIYLYLLLGNICLVNE